MINLRGKNMANFINAYDVDEAECKFGYGFILEGIIERIKTQLEELNIPIEQNELRQIYNFLSTIVDGKVWIEFTEELPEMKGYNYASAELKAHTLYFAYGVNTFQSRFPNALYISIKTDYEKKFRAFWEKNYLPTCLLEEAISYLDVTKPITVHVFETTYHWRGALNNAKHPIVFGQDINSKNFKTFRPIGFVDGNFLVLTSPNEYNDPMGRVANYI